MSGAHSALEADSGRGFLDSRDGGSINLRQVM